MGWPEVILILVVLLVVFGAGKLPQIGTAIGGGIRELRQAADEKPEPPATDPDLGAPEEPERRG